MDTAWLRDWLGRAFGQWRRHDAPTLAAALAYYALFSLAPLLIVVIAICGVVFGPDAARGEVFARLRGVMGDEGAQAVQALVENARRPAAGLLATLSGLLAALLGATGVFAQLRQALNTIWGLPTPGTLRGLMRHRLAAFVLVLLTGALLLASVALSTTLAGIVQVQGEARAAPAALAEVVHFSLSFATVAALLAAIYRYLPEARLPWSAVWPGAAAASLLLTIGKSLIGLYLGRSGVASAFGAAGSLVAVLVWVYYSAQIVLFGAELAWVRFQRATAASPAEARAKDLPISEAAPASRGRTLGAGDRHGSRVREQGRRGSGRGAGAGGRPPADARRGAGRSEGGGAAPESGAGSGGPAPPAPVGPGRRPQRDAAPRSRRG